MDTTRLARLAATAAVSGALAQLLATLLEPDWASNDMRAAARVVAGNSLWDVDRLLDLAGILLTIGALTVVGRLLSAAGNEWPRLGQAFLVLLGAFGGAAVVTGAAMKDMAAGWVESNGAGASGYLASFDAVRRVSEDLFFAAFLALGLYLAALSAAILTTAVFARWIGWCAGIAAALVLCGNILSIWSDPAWLLVLAGFALFLAVALALGISLWRLPARRSSSQGHPTLERTEQEA